MKGILKLRSSGFSVVLLLLAMLTVNNSEVNEDNIKNYLDSDCHSVANYIENNFSLFVEKYNESTEEDKLNASYIENKINVIIDESGTKCEGVFLDFNFDNGYALIGDDYNFYDFSTSGESPYKDIQSESFYYSTLSGYLYLKDDDYINVDASKNYSNDNLEDLTFESAYKGQTKAGCGHINDIAEYVKSRYGSDWKSCKNKSLSMSTGEYTTQDTLSCYTTNKIENDEIVSYTEGSCWFVSAYNVLQSLADSSGDYKKKVNTYKTDSKINSMPSLSDTTKYDAKVEETNIYSQYYDSNDHNISGILKTSTGNTSYKVRYRGTRTFPKLYTDVRKYVTSIYNKVNGGTIYNTANIINQVGRQYGYNFKAKGTVLAGLYGSSGITAVNNNLPFVLCTSNVSNAGYGNHLMAGCGYQIYSKTSGWWIFKTTSHKYFYELRDGHSQGKVYLDLSALIGFGGIVLLDYSIFKY